MVDDDVADMDDAGCIVTSYEELVRNHVVIRQGTKLLYFGVLIIMSPGIVHIGACLKTLFCTWSACIFLCSAQHVNCGKRNVNVIE